jgi:hypothetical protein
LRIWCTRSIAIPWRSRNVVIPRAAFARGIPLLSFSTGEIPRGIPRSARNDIAASACRLPDRVDPQNFFIRQIFFRRSSRPIRTTRRWRSNPARRGINPSPIHFNLRSTAHLLTPISVQADFSSAGFSLCAFELGFLGFDFRI